MARKTRILLVPMISSDEVSSFKPFLSEALRPRGPIANKTSQCSFVVLILARKPTCHAGDCAMPKLEENMKPKGEVLLEKQAEVIHLLGANPASSSCIIHLRISTLAR
jgi:hypothetical protein